MVRIRQNLCSHERPAPAEHAAAVALIYSFRARCVILLAVLLASSAARAQATSEVTLAWDAPPDPTVIGYRIHYGVTRGFYNYRLDVGNVTQATVYELAEGSTYYFVVKSYNAAWIESEPSDEVSYTVPFSQGGTAPIASGGTYRTAEDQRLSIVLHGSDPDGDALTFGILTRPSHGRLLGVPPTLVYEPTANFSGADFFTFSARDGEAESKPAVVSITVLPVNDAPVAQWGSASLEPAKPGSPQGNLTHVTYAPLPLWLWATDVDGDALTYEIVSPPRRGRLSGLAPGLVYLPDVTFRGADAFTFRVRDRQSVSAVAEYTIRDPFTPYPPPRLAGQLIRTAGHPLDAWLHMEPISGAVSWLEFSTDLSTWEPWLLRPAGLPIDFHWTPTGPEPAGFFRVAYVMLDGTVAGSANQPVAQIRYSENVLGVMHPAVAPGYALIANPLWCEPDTVDALFPDVPPGTFLMKLGTGGAMPANVVGDAGWSTPDESLVPGEGAYFYNPSQSPLAVAWLGEVPEGRFSMAVPDGVSLVAAPFPGVGRLDADLGFPAAEGDQVYRYQPAQRYYAGHYFSAGLWDPTPVLSVGESFLLLTSEPALWSGFFGVRP